MFGGSAMCLFVLRVNEVLKAVLRGVRVVLGFPRGDLELINTCLVWRQG